MIDEIQNDAESSADEISETCTVPAVKEKDSDQTQVTEFLALIK